MTRRLTFHSIPEHLRDASFWPVCDITQLNEVERKKFEKRARALREYLTNGRLSDASAIAGCCRSTFLNLLTRCVTISSDGRIFGFSALMKGIRLGDYSRTKSLPEGRLKASTGACGAFQSLLRAHPDLHRLLDECIERGGTTSKKSGKPRAIDVHRTFVALCSTRVAPDSYPLNSRSKARRSVERYVRAYLDRHQSSVRTWYGEDAARRLSLGTGFKSFVLGDAPFDVVAFDAHKIHCICTIEVPGPVGIQAIAIERLWLNVLIDSGCSNAVLGYSIAIGKEINASHVEQAVKSCLSPWRPRPRKSQAGWYLQGAGLPVGTIPGLQGCRFAKLTLDNAMQHFATRIVSGLRRAIGCAISWGQVGGWWRNSEVERLFETLEGRGFQRLPSSTGSNSQDPLRGDPVREALSNRITWEEIVDLVDVFVSNYNATPQRALGGQTPLTVLRTHLDPQRRSFIQRPPVPTTAFTPQLGVAAERRSIRGSLQLGTRPYVEIDGLRYSAEALARLFNLIGTKAIVHIDESDMSCVEVFQENGLRIGKLEPLSARWRGRKFSRDLIKAINAHARNEDNAILDAGDPVNLYMHDLVSKASDAGRVAPERIHKAATRLAATALMSGIDVKEFSKRPNGQAGRRPIRPLPPSLPEPTWET